jgi:hypothetical protein
MALSVYGQYRITVVNYTPDTIDISSTTFCVYPQFTIMSTHDQYVRSTFRPRVCSSSRKLCLSLQVTTMSTHGQDVCSAFSSLAVLHSLQ